ncbi:capsular exopolysaccharide synthesis family protein [Novosphingobium kunmingense]|uniref:non-specific protein-tyrosine kinase n=1 Tax=Novosphingobium kunmingense TaxID=1211806 RepID=A0A2N0HK76_9SPHN|nr:polysaccharide biosynthesis tyrosine autokinase [Novosphingobium kunmingense]PKB19299.1 capsular exopolysaccharide synthesis family protein [Novosphingobium kunmingense]
MATNLPADSFHHAHGHHDPADAAALFGPSRAAFDLRYLLALVRSNIWMILGVIAAALALALVATLLQTPRYTATSTIQINDQSERVLGNRDDSTNLTNGSSWDTERFLNSQTEILRSRGLAQRVAQSLKLIGNPAFYKAQGIDTPPTALTAEEQRNLTAGLLIAGLTIELPRDSRIVTIGFESTDPEMAARVANAYGNEFIQANLQRRFDSSSYARGFLAQQLDESRRKLEASERALNDYSRAAGLIRTQPTSTSGSGGDTSGSGGSVTTSSLLQINAAANDAIARRIQAEARWRAVSGVPLLASTEVIANPSVAALVAQRAQIQAALEQDRATHLSDYPSVRAKESELAAITAQLTQAAQNVRNAVRSEYQSALAAEQQLTAQVGQLKNATLSEQDKTVQYSLLSREAETNRQLYEGLLERYKTLNAVAGVSLSNVNIIDKAEAPDGPSSPKLLKNLLIGLIVGLGLAGALLFVRDQFDDSIRVPEDVETKLALPLLGVIPKAQDGDPKTALADPKSPMSEAYNSLRGSLLYSTTEGLPRVMLVTSAQPSEGKTTSSQAIAAGFARMGKRVLLIDADMRRPSLHRRTGIDGDRGLSTLLTSHEPLAAAIVPSGNDNLSFLMAGPVPPSPTELLSTARIEQILEEAAAAYDVVVIDSPPILGLADAPLISALVDGVVFVVEADRNRRGSLKTSLRRLRAMRPLLLGAVLTKFDPLKAGNRYSEYYGYDYYQYGSDRKDHA